MNAGKLVRKYGEDLIGREIDTPAMGTWEGGICIVTELRPDPGAPEIVMQAQRKSDGESIGVFRHEDVELLPEPEIVDTLHGGKRG